MLDPKHKKRENPYSNTIPKTSYLKVKDRFFKVNWYQRIDEEYGHGKLHVCSFTDTLGVKHNIDMYGNDIHERGYSPKVIEYRYDDYIENV